MEQQDFSKYDVYATSGSVYCYAETNVLYNRFGIRDNSLLRKIEADITAIRQLDMLDKPIMGRFTVTHLCKIHRYIFGDIYYFAGRLRREGIAKGDTIFENHNTVPIKLNTLLEKLKRQAFLKKTTDTDFIPQLAYYFSELNYIHPFREGNGRAIREFIRQLLLVNGYAVDWSAVDIDLMQAAMAASVYDTALLIYVLECCIHPS